MNDRLKKQMNFIMEVDKIKKIGRQTYLSDASRKENDAEHSWHLALMCMLLKEYANEEVDVLRTMEMVLIHDLVEIDAGDTYAYDDKGNESKRDREVKAAERIFHLLPDDQAEFVRELWDEFEERKTAESRFANALDKLQPLSLNDFTDGLAWREHGIYAEQVVKRNEGTKDGSKELWELCMEMIEKNQQKGNLK